jgi:DNA polymerase III epsilon subunit-like protein
MVVRVIDIETTGTDPEEDAVIEIASVDLQADGATAPYDL